MSGPNFEKHQYSDFSFSTGAIKSKKKKKKTINSELECYVLQKRKLSQKGEHNHNVNTSVR